MTQRTISLSDDVYNDLKNEKRDNESFCQVIERMLGKKKKANKILKLYGVWKDQGDEWNRIEEEIYRDRIQGTVERNF
jgi:predicted CopG family antitoxin